MEDSPAGPTPPGDTLASELPLADTFEAEYLLYHKIFPVAMSEGRLKVAVAGDVPVEVLDDLELSYDCALELVDVEPAVLEEAVRRTFAAAESMVELVKELNDSGSGEADTWDDVQADVRDLADQPPVVRFVNLLLREAYEARASDVHLEATRAGMEARFRVDGVLGEAPAPPRGLQAAVVSRIKLLAELDIAERRLPQDGRFRVRLEDRELDIRVSTVPTLAGESVVLRLLDRGGRPVGLDDLGMAPEVLQPFRGLVSRPHGIVLVTGPTGSGKTTTLYAALMLRRAHEEKIVTVEDPVEYHLPGVTQVPINAKAGMTFPAALRSILRQDPDVLMVGEMRDPETAAIAVQAAMTGHLVLATLHTNDATSAIPRLVDLAVESYRVAATLDAVLAQRLVRRICPECRERYRPDPQLIALLAEQPVGRLVLERGRGCAACRHTGYRGRTGCFELFVVGERWKHDIARDSANSRRRAQAVAEGMVTLKQDGWRKVQAGITTVEEVLRVTEG